MEILNEVKARLDMMIRGLSGAVQEQASVIDHIQSISNEIRDCIDRANLIEPAVEVLKHRIQTLEEMFRVRSLRDNEASRDLGQENAELKRDLAALRQALRHDVEQYQVQLAESDKSNKALVQRTQSLEHFNNVLKSRVNEMQEQYDSVVIDNVELKDAVKTLQSTSASNLITNNLAATSHSTFDKSQGLIPFGKTVVETNRGLTVTIESSPASSPDKTSLNHGWIPQLPSGAAFPFPDIAVQPQSGSLTPGNGESSQVVMRAPGKPKARPIVRGTQEANESYERVMRSLASSPLVSPANLTSTDNKTTAPSSLLVSSPAMSTINPSRDHPVTSSNEKSKLNPAVPAFSPSNSSSKDSAKSGSVQTSSLSKNEVKPPGTATKTKEGLISPQIRRLSNISIEEPSTTIKELPVKDEIKVQDTAATGDQNKFAKATEPPQTTSLTPRILPHLRHLTSVTKNQDVYPTQVQRLGKGKITECTIERTKTVLPESALTGMKENLQVATKPGAFVSPDHGFQAWLDLQEKAKSENASGQESASITNDMLIEIDPEDAPTAEKKSVPLPPGFSLYSVNNTSAKTETATHRETYRATSPNTFHDYYTSQNPTTDHKEAAPGHNVSAETTSKKEKNVALMTEYNNALSLVSLRYGKDSAPPEDFESTFHPSDAAGYYRPKPNGTHELGSLLDDECSEMVLKPREVKIQDAGLEWKAVRKNGKVVYVL